MECLRKSWSLCSMFMLCTNKMFHMLWTTAWIFILTYLNFKYMVRLFKLYRCKRFTYKIAFGCCSVAIIFLFSFILSFVFSFSLSIHFLVISSIIYKMDNFFLLLLFLFSLHIQPGRHMCLCIAYTNKFLSSIT